MIGGGIAGVATAWHLHQLGVPVVLCEKGRIAGEQSSRNGGWIRKQGRKPAELPLIAESLKRWHAIVAELDEDIGWHTGGVTYLIESDADAARHHAWLEHAQGLDSRLLSARETDALFPGIRARHQGALYTPSDARAEPARAVPAMARHLRAAGSCGALPPERPKGIAGLGIRQWCCGACDAHHDRDINAARNILAVGHDRLAGEIPAL